MKLLARRTARTAAQTPGPAVPNQAYWSLPAEQLLAALRTSTTGLSQADADQRLEQYGPNVLQAQRSTSALRLYLNQLKSPLVLILIFAAIISSAVRERTDAAIVLLVRHNGPRLAGDGHSTIRWTKLSARMPNRPAWTSAATAR